VEKLQHYIDCYGPEAGPKLYRILRSRAAYKGVSTRRRRQLQALTGQPLRARRRPRAMAPRLPLFPEPAPAGPGPGAA
jgi:hypothetical protein